MLHKRTAIFANATYEKEAYGVSFAKLTSMSYVAGYRAANFITMGSPAYNSTRELCKRAQLYQHINKPSPHHNSKRNFTANT